MDSSLSEISECDELSLTSDETQPNVSCTQPSFISIRPKLERAPTSNICKILACTEPQQIKDMSSSCSLKPTVAPRPMLPPTSAGSPSSVSPGSIFDSHCHLDFLVSKLNKSKLGLEEILRHDPKFDVSTFGGCIANYCNPRSWVSSRKLTEELKPFEEERRVHLSLGCHPHFAGAAHFDSVALAQLELVVKEFKRRVVAVGECGLDYSRYNHLLPLLH